MKAKVCMYAFARFALAAAMMFSVAKSSPAAQLRTDTAAAFHRYIALSETRMNASLNSSHAFLWIDRLPKEQRAAALARLQAGHVVIERLETLENGKPMAVPDGLVHGSEPCLFPV